MTSCLTITLADTVSCVGRLPIYQRVNLNLTTVQVSTIGAIPNPAQRAQSIVCIANKGSLPAAKNQDVFSVQ